MLLLKVVVADAYRTARAVMRPGFLQHYGDRLQVSDSRAAEDE